MTEYECGFIDGIKSKVSAELTPTLINVSKTMLEMLKPVISTALENALNDNNAITETDVQPVKQGRWIDIYEWAKMHDSIPSGMCLYYWCSECQKEQEKKSNFCPNCGAEMIEGGNENDTL